jgi:hypothetical protein
MIATQLAQSEKADSVPFITVERDARGGACWVVVGLGTEVRCYCGQRAMAMLEMMCRSKGISVPQ